MNKENFIDSKIKELPTKIFEPAVNMLRIRQEKKWSNHCLTGNRILYSQRY